MPTNPYNHTLNPGFKNSQRLLDQLNREAIKFAGLDMYYIPRDIVSKDSLFNEDIQSQFNEGYRIEMFIESAEGFEGQELLQQFGVEVRDEVTVVVNKKRFHEIIHSTPHESLKRPREGDLVYLPMSKGVYEIMFVEHEDPFYQVGTVPNYKLRMQLFEYSGEDFETDIIGLDQADESQEQGIEAEGFLYKMTLDSSANWTLGETITQTSSAAVVTGEIVKIEDDGATIFASNVASSNEDYNIFVSGEAIIGSDSGNNRVITTVITDMDDFADNLEIETEADTIIDNSEPNVFGFDV